MSPKLEFDRTYVRYIEDGHQVDIPIEYVHVEPDVLDIEANNIDVWRVPAGEPIPTSKRDAIVAYIRAFLDRDGTVYTVHEAMYLKRRAAPYQVTFDGIPAAPVVTYTKNGHRAVFALRPRQDGRQVVHLRATPTWSDPANVPITAADRAVIEAEIHDLYAYLVFA